MISIIYKGFIIQGNPKNGDLAGKIHKIDRGDTNGFTSVTYTATGNPLPEWDEVTNNEILEEIQRVGEKVAMLEVGVVVLTWMGFLAYLAAIINII